MREGKWKGGKGERKGKGEGGREKEEKGRGGEEPALPIKKSFPHS